MLLFATLCQHNLIEITSGSKSSMTKAMNDMHDIVTEENDENDTDAADGDIESAAVSAVYDVESEEDAVQYADQHNSAGVTSPLKAQHNSGKDYQEEEDDLLHQITLNTRKEDARLKSEAAARRRSKDNIKMTESFKETRQKYATTMSVHGANSSIYNNILEIDAFVCNEPESLRALNIPLGCEGEERELAEKVLRAAGSGGRESIVQELLFRWNVKEDVWIIGIIVFIINHCHLFHVPILWFGWRPWIGKVGTII